MRKGVAILLCLVVVVSLTACQPTPSDTAVVGKGGGQLENAIKQQELAPDATQANMLHEENKWVENYSLPHIECKIDAEIALPNTDKYPVFKVKKRILNTEEINGVISYFLSDATGVREEGDTKEDLTQRLIAVKRGMPVNDDEGNVKFMPYEGQEAEIKALEEQIRSMPDEVSYGPVSDGLSALPASKVYCLPDKSEASVHADVDYLTIDIGFNGLIQPESWIINGDAYPGEPEGTTLDNVKIPKEQAQETAVKIMGELGLNNLGVARVEKGRLINLYNYDTLSEGWIITFARNDGGSLPVDMKPEQVIGMLQYDMDEYNERWYPEAASMFIDEKGVRSFSWEHPLEIVETVSENTALKPMEEVKELAKKYIKFGCSWMDEKKINNTPVLTVYKLALTNLLVPVKDDNEHYMLVPSWLVYYYDNQGIWQLSTVFAFNAVDGARINLVTRYPAPPAL